MGFLVQNEFDLSISRNWEEVNLRYANTFAVKELEGECLVKINTKNTPQKKILDFNKSISGVSTSNPIP
mgnify:CR=1 FL=1